MAYSDLLTFEQLQDLAFGGEKLLDDATSQTEVELVIREESQRIQSFLHTNVIATSYEQVIRLDEWEENPAYDDDEQEAYLQHTPVTEVLTDDYVARRERFVATGDPDNVVIDYVAGYLRPDQTLADLQGEVPDATVTPDTLPQDLRQACARLCLYRLTEAKEGLTGRNDVTQSVGSQATVVQSMQTTYVQRILDSLTHYRRRT